MKPTSAQIVILHVAESAGISALMTLIAGVYQYIITNGLNVPGLLGFLGIAFVACLTMVYKSVRSDPALGQAAIDTANEAKALAAQAIPFLHDHGLNVVPAPAQPIVRPTVQSALQSLASPAPSATSTAFSPLPPITTPNPTPQALTATSRALTPPAPMISPRDVFPAPGALAAPQQPFPASAFDWTGVVSAVKP